MSNTTATLAHLHEFVCFGSDLQKTRRGFYKISEGMAVKTGYNFRNARAYVLLSVNGKVTKFGG